MSALSRFLRVELAPPEYLSIPITGIDISTSGIKIARTKERLHGVELVEYGEYILPTGAMSGGEITDRDAVIKGLRSLAKDHRISAANIALPEARGYLFEAEVPAGATLSQAKVAVERRLDEYVPLPAAEVSFDITGADDTHVVGMGYSRRVIEETLAIVEEAGIHVRAMESETFALPRAVLPHRSEETALLIDIGRTTTKLMIVTRGIPRYVTTLDIGGHALTLAVVKHFGVSEEEAKRVKAERGIVPGAGNEEYLAAMISTVSVIRDEILTRLEYWQSHSQEGGHTPATRAVLVGGNASILGLPEYLESSLKIPVALGDAFTNFAPKESWLPPLSYTESLGYGTAIGLALRDYAA